MRTIYSVKDEKFRPYGRVYDGLPDAVQEIMTALEKTPLPDAGTAYTAQEPLLENLPARTALSVSCYGGMPVQLGWCNGRNTKLNCLEYHRDSEFNLGTEDFILLLARREDLCDGKLDTDRVKAFRVPAGTLVEVYATTLHYAPCHTDPCKGFRVLIALPRGTNLQKPAGPVSGPDGAWLWACNKWLLAHPESPEAAQGAYQGLTGTNIDLKEDL